MIVAVDVAYSEVGAKAVAAVFKDWDSDSLVKTWSVELPNVEEYVPGQFFRRELPCLEKLLAQSSEVYEFVVIDGYVHLGELASPGLGFKLWESLGKKIPVIGVAKSAFPGMPEETKLFRGGSARALYVTAAGVPLDYAKQCIAHMHGKFRFPTILKLVDQLTRE